MGGCGADATHTVALPRQFGLKSLFLAEIAWETARHAGTVAPMKTFAQMQQNRPPPGGLPRQASICASVC
jgi:hypothetical protein